MYIKNLSRLNRNLSEIVLVDNAAYSYALQLANGIPILPYYDGKDYELSALESYL
jgi:CTD small phosphatase-like protein 2